MGTRHTKKSVAVLLLAYGTPDKPEDILPYYTDVRRGNPPEPHLLKELEDRYAAIGGTTPLTKITRQQATRLQKRLGIPVYIGMKHWHPLIAKTIEEMKKDGIQKIIALVMAPHFSTMSIGDYKNRLARALEEIAPKMEVEFIPSWGDNSQFITSLCRRIDATRKLFPIPEFEKIEVVFTAHSLPMKILDSGDPYQQQLMQTSQLAAKKLHLPKWRMAFQSAGRTRDTWLGPDILQELQTLRKEKRRQVLVAPIGFTTDNLEILYDLDIQAADMAKNLGLTFRRIPLGNATAQFVDALEQIVTPYLL